MKSELQFGLPRDQDTSSRRAKTLVVSLVVHMLFVAVVIVNPTLFSSTPKRIIRIAGQDYDLARTELRELVLPPRDMPRPNVPERPMVQPPAPPPDPAMRQPQPQPPPPPPPQTPLAVISPDDVIADGARPDASPKPSRGNTEEAARVAGGEDPKPPAPKPEPADKAGTEQPKDNAQIRPNTNPNALRLPNLADQAGRIVNRSIEDSIRNYPKGNSQTGLPNVQEVPNFSTEDPTILSDTKGYDFGPYMNQVINRVRVNWYSLIPEAARLGRRGRVVVIFTITDNGTIANLRLAANSGADPLDRAATGAIQASNPFPKLPDNFDGDHLVLQFTFLYNMR